MKKEEIDKRDRELLKKIDKIRKKNIASGRKTTHKIFFFTSISIIIILSLYAAVKKNGIVQNSIIQENFKVTSNADNQDVLKKNRFSANADNVTRQVNFEQKIDTKSDNVTFQQETGFDLAAEKNILPVVTAVQKKPADNKTVASNSGTIIEDIKVNIKTGNSLLRISGCSVCSDIKNRNPQGPKKIFYIKHDRFAFVWTEIWAESFPTTIYHTYYLNGEKKYTVPLKIKYIRMRTWSKITLTNETKAGLWKVEISLEDGTILKQVEFEVKNPPNE
ncbi:hypothetical protein BuS5_02125 [Desulfosarcina sp. BuS5]|uniref:DUF2914 domain-containing protein n=1 Tax=Desulfosarcina sp. BuS5 TaxID=933262 RepID=UPI0005524624|nr:DUF2914 domain-containing protein [Desulfosarcina sp. BuS5]WDN89157.1 hypothetical protein BuS5_02125 [Desulfosarcina sp. BuS5]